MARPFSTSNLCSATSASADQEDDPRMEQSVRTPAERKRDTLHRLEHDVDAWIATADSASGTPYLVPLSFLWDGMTLLISTPTASPTGRNLLTSGRVRLGIGPTRDLVLIEGSGQPIPAAEIADGLWRRLCRQDRL